MTEIFIKCGIHNKEVHLDKLIFNKAFVAECGCTFVIYSYDVRNMTEQNKKNSESKYVDDHQGKRYQDGSRELKGIMLQDGSYI